MHLLLLILCALLCRLKSELQALPGASDILKGPLHLPAPDTQMVYADLYASLLITPSFTQA